MLKVTLILICIVKTESNPILHLIQSFGKIYNVMQIIACSLLPKSATNPVLWGVITTDLEIMGKNMWKHVNGSKTTQCNEKGKYSLQWTPPNATNIVKCSISKPKTLW